ncbi:MAG: hypothetical protein RRY34_09990, partial [Victivallaceae bacterium]
MSINSDIVKIRVGLASCGVAAGGMPVYEMLKERAGGVTIDETGCIGHCYAEPLVEVVTKDGSSGVKANEKAIDNILALGEAGRFKIHEGRASKEMPKVLKLAGRVVPTDFEDYLAHGGYEGLKKALKMAPEDV